MPASPWKNILVAVRDPMEQKQIAIAKAARIAERTGAALTLFHAFAAPLSRPEIMPDDASEILRLVAKQRHAALLKLTRPLRAKGLKVRCEAVWDFPPAHAIVREVLASKPDLVVAESHRHSRIARWFLTNSDWDLIRECPCPVWFVKRERFAAKPLILTAIDPSHAHAKPSRLDDRLLQETRSVAQQLGGRIALVHVADTSTPLPRRFMRRGASADASAEVPAVTMEAIDRLARRNKIDAATEALRAGVPADEIAASAAELKADLLVMGAVSRSGLSHSHIGSTAEAVIDGVGCDLLIVKPRQFKTAVPRRRQKLPAAVR